MHAPEPMSSWFTRLHETAIPRLHFDFATPALYKLSCTPFLLFIQLPAYVSDLLGASDTSKVSSRAVSRLVGSRIVTKKRYVH